MLINMFNGSNCVLNAVTKRRYKLFAKVLMMHVGGRLPSHLQKGFCGIALLGYAPTY